MARATDFSQFPADRDSPEPGPEFSRLRRSFTPAFEIAPSEQADPVAEMRFRATERFVLSEVTARQPYALLRARREIACARADVVAIRLVAAGRATGLAGAAAFAAEAGDLVFLDLTQTLEWRAAPREDPAADITLWLARSVLSRALGEEGDLHGWVVRSGAPAAALIGACLRSLAASASRCAAADLDALALGVVDLTARALAPARISGEPGPLDTFVSLRRHIDRNLTSPKLDADSLAKTFGLSRATLYRLFEPVGGVASFIRKRRIERAHAILTDPALADRRVAPTAYGVGFKSLVTFARAFEEAYGVTPAAARRAARSGAPVPAPATALEGSLASCLMRLRP